MQSNRGVYFFIRDEALRELKMTETPFASPCPLAGKGRVVRIRSGFYSIVPSNMRRAVRSPGMVH